MNKNLSKLEWSLLVTTIIFISLSVFLYYFLCKNLFNGGFNDVLEIIAVLALTYGSFIFANYSITLLAEKYCSRRVQHEDR
nr:hypothetical protein OA7_04600 [Vibrio cyclitrophicus 1F53]